MSASEGNSRPEPPESSSMPNATLKPSSEGEEATQTEEAKRAAEAKAQEKAWRNAMNNFNLSFTREVQTKIERLDEVIGGHHWLSVGTYKERVIRDQIAAYVPKQYSVGTGFVMGKNGGISKQIDLLVWDSTHYSPWFVDGDFVVIPPKAVRIAIEVKGNLTRKALREGLENLDSLSQFSEEWLRLQAWDQPVRCERLLVGGRLGNKLKFPDHLFYYMNRLYTLSGRSFSDRQAVTKLGASAATSEWISGILVLGSGSILLNLLSDENRNALVTYPVVNDAKADGDNTIGLLRQVVLDALMRQRFFDSFYWRNYLLRTPDRRLLTPRDEEALVAAKNAFNMCGFELADAPRQAQQDKAEEDQEEQSEA